MSLVQDAPARAALRSATQSGWRTVLTHVEPGKSSVPRIEAAVALARRFDALLIGLGAEMIEPVTFADPYGSWDGQVLTAMRDQVQVNIAHAERAFTSHTAQVRAEWRRVEDRPVPAMARVSRSADVIVAGGMPIRSVDGYRTADSAELALTSGRPVLVVPPHGGVLEGKKILVAWKETRESRRAIADALPLLKLADEVVVVEVCEGGDAVGDAVFHAGEVAEGLKRHGVNARGKAVTAKDDDVVPMLNAEAKVVGADLIVAGCYGHSRMNEWFFGGVTRGLLGAPRRFVLMSH